MLRDRIEHRWIEAFAEALALSKIGAGDEAKLSQNALSFYLLDASAHFLSQFLTFSGKQLR